MDIIIKLQKYKGWINSNCTSVCGYGFVNDEYLDNQNLLNEVSSLKNISDVESFLLKLNGCFSVVKSSDSWGIAAVDLIQNYPLFYTKCDNMLVISDDARVILDYIGKKSAIPLDMEIEYASCSYALGKSTFFPNVYQIQSGEYIWWDGNSFGCCTYFTYGKQYINNDYNEDYTWWFNEIKKVEKCVGKRLVRSLNGRQAVIPLSGGYDSRAVVQMLAEEGYDNIICYTYGTADNSEVIKAQEVSKILGYPIIFVEQKNKDFRNLWNDSRFMEWFNSLNNCIGIPYIQHYLGAKYLIDNHKIDDDAIFMSGNSGDFLQGAHIDRKIMKLNSINDVLMPIVEEHFMLSKQSNYKNEKIQSEILKYIPNKENFSPQEAAGILDKFNWRERQSKYVTNEVRGFEVLGHEWRLPLWDKELMLFWDNVPVEIKAERGLYKKYKKATDPILSVNYNDSLEINYTKKQQIANWLKKEHPSIIKRLYYFERVLQYFVSPQHWNGLVSFSRYMQLVKKSGGGLSGWSICSIIAELQIENMKSQYEKYMKEIN